MNLMLFFIAWVLIMPLTVWNLIVVNRKYGNTKGYFRSTALSLDIWAKTEFRTLWKHWLFQEDWQYLQDYDWHSKETLSSMLGKCQRDEKENHKTLLETQLEIYNEV